MEIFFEVKFLVYLIFAFQKVMPQSLVPEISWDFKNVFENGKVYPEEKVESQRSTLITSRNIGDFLQGTSIEWDETMNAQVAYFNGTNSGVVVQNLTGLCMLRPRSCTNGFSAAFWMKWVKWKSYYIFTSSSFAMKQLIENIVAIEVFDEENQKSWRIFMDVNSTVEMGWQFFTMTWSLDNGLTVYLDGVNKSSETNTENFGFTTVESKYSGDRLAFGTTTEEIKNELNIRMYFNKFMIWEHKLKSSEVEEIYQNALNETISPPTRLSYSTIEDKDFTLSGQLITTLQVENHSMCYIKCIRYGATCKSYNFQYKKINLTTHTCELNNATKYDAAKWKFIRKENFVYYEVS